jgi:uncharacterized protein (TIGR00369 family)
MNEFSMSDNVPTGFRLFDLAMGFLEHVGPLYWRSDPDDFALGFRVTERHINPANIVHGGMLVTVADMTLALGVRAIEDVDAFLPTINLNCDFLAPARLGDWVEGRIVHSKATRGTAFATCLLIAGETEVLRGSGIMKIPRADDARFAMADKHRVVV